MLTEKIAGPKSGQAIKFAAFIVKDAETVGKDAALEIKTPFDEKQLLEGNREFVFENMPGVKHFKILNVEEQMEIENSKNAREAALPGKPSVFFF